MKTTDLYNRWVGRKFGQLTVIDVLPKRKALCKCDCGKTTEVFRNNLPRGNTLSCGCTWRQRAADAIARHRKTGTRVYRVWSNMKSRCNNPNFTTYKYYGGRGIKVCRRWHDFSSFYEDMGDPPSRKHSIDRIDNDGNYEPSNCRWATMKQQCANRRPKGTTDSYNESNNRQQ